MNFKQPPVDPFPPATELEVFFEIGQLTFHFLIIVLLIGLMLYSYRNLKDSLPVLVIYSFSLLIGANSLSHGHPPFSPLLEIFFMVFQTTILLLTAINIKEKNKTKFNI